MADLSGFPSAEVQFDRDARVVGSVTDALQLAGTQGLTDLVVVSHGWNNDVDDARRLYRGIASSLRAVLAANAVNGLSDRTIATLCVFWPSKKFAESDLIPGAAAATVSPITAELITEQIEDLRPVFPDPEAQATLDTMKRLVPALPDKQTARTSFADLARSLLNRDSTDFDDASVDLFDVSGKELMDRLAVPVTLLPPDRGSGGASGGVGALGQAVHAEGGAAGLGSLLGGMWGATRNLLNFTTYYAMKDRAGIIGDTGLARLLDRVHKEHPDPRIHLVGHSFGGRLVSAAARALPASAPSTLATLTLLQAAFSHFGFSAQWEPQRTGHFRNVITNKTVNGPMLITHTGNDKAVGIAYAIASRIAGQAGAGVGDAKDTYGGIGRNGAQRTKEALNGELLDVGQAYTWQAGAMHNLRADRFISGHSDVTGRQVAHAILSAIAST